MIPIEKNIIVTDVDGRRIGTTYPKRAKGLLKNGRAEYVNDREIRLTNTHASAVYTIMECHYYGANMYDIFPAFGMNPIPDKIPPTGNN